MGTFAKAEPDEDDEVSLDAIGVTIPVMVNTKPLKMGEELVVYWPARPDPGTKSKKQPSTWVDEARKDQRKRPRAM